MHVLFQFILFIYCIKLRRMSWKTSFCLAASAVSVINISEFAIAAFVGHKLNPV